MISVSLSVDWIRRVRTRVIALLSAAVAATLVYEMYCLVNRDLRGVVIGASGTLGILGIGMIWTWALKLAVALIRNQRRLGRIEYKAAASGEHAPLTTAPKDTSKDERFATLVGRVEQFCDSQEDKAHRMERRLAALESLARRAGTAADLFALDETDWNEEESPGENTLTAFSFLLDEAAPGESVAGVALKPDSIIEKRALRLEFAALIHRRDYSGALSTGDELSNRFPESKAANDFRRVRPHLVRKIQFTETNSRLQGTSQSEADASD